MKRKYAIRTEVWVTIEVDEDYTDEWGGLLDPRRQEGIYNLETRDEMLQHLAYNAVVNGQSDASRLDGWADIPAEHLSMSVDYHTTDPAWWDVDDLGAVTATG